MDEENSKDMGETKIVSDNKFSRGVIWGLVLVVIVVAIFVFQKDNPTGDTVQIGSEEPRVAAWVNGQAITIEELENAFASLSLQYGNSVSRDDALARLIQEEVFYQAAKEQDIIIDAETTKQKVEEFKSSSGLTEEQFAQSLVQAGLTDEEFLDRYTKQLMIQRFVNENFLSDIVVTDEEVENYYSNNKERFKIEEGVTVRHILIGDAELTSEEQDAKAEELLNEVNEENFCDYVAEHSTDVASISTCGEYTFSVSDPYVEEFKELSFKQSQGEIGIVITQFGAHIIWTVEKMPAQTLALEDVREQTRGLLKQQKLQERYSNFYESIAEGDDIEILI